MIEIDIKELNTNSIDYKFYNKFIKCYSEIGNFEKNIIVEKLIAWKKFVRTI